MLKPCSLVASLLLGLSLSVPLHAGEADLDPQLRKMIEWLPADSETLMVVNEPFKFTDWDEQSVIDKSSPEERIEWLSEGMQRLAAGGLFSLETKELNDALQDLPVERAIAGSRRFRRANGLGAWPYEGCQVIKFKESADSAIAKAFAIYEDHATVMTEIGGHPVAVFERPSQSRANLDDWTFYVCHPQPGVLLRATHHQYLEEVLARLDKPGKTRAFPKELAQWNHVDVKAPFWALRHYRIDRAKVDPSIPLSSDPGTIGFTFWLEEGAKSPKAHYLTKSEGAEGIVSAVWNGHMYGLSPKFKLVDSGVVEITADFPTDEATVIYLLFLHGYLGHGVNL